MTDLSIDNHKLMYHPERVAQWKKTGDCFPIYVEIGPTNRCNHKCIFCALDFLEHETQDIKKETLLSNLEDMAKHGVKSVMFAGEGEPLVHKDTPLFIENAKEQGMDVSTTTNGVLFNQRKTEQCSPNLTWARFSVNSGTAENYAEVHGTNKKDFDKVIGNIKYAVEFKKENKLQTTLGVQTLLLSANAHTIEDLARICRDIGADNLQIKPYSHHPQSKNDWIVDEIDAERLEEKLMALETQDFEIHFRKKTKERIQQGATYSECYGLPFFALISANGDVIPCNLFYDNSEFTYGNLNNQTFSEIWQGEKRKQVLEKLRKNGVDNCRKGCRLDPINRYLERLIKPGLHDNFI